MHYLLQGDLHFDKTSASLIIGIQVGEELPSKEVFSIP